jgi:hypothetical protein
MDSTFTSPLFDLFRRREAPLEVRLLAARGALAPRAHEQLSLLILLAGDEDELVRDAAEATIARIPLELLSAFLARPDVDADALAFFARRGIASAAAPLVDVGRALVGEEGEEPADTEAEEPERAVPLSALGVTDRMKLAMRGRREQRAVLIHDPNRLVAAAVLSSPKLTGSEVEAFARMGNVSDEALRLIGSNRTWIKQYPVAAALTRNPKTPLGVSMLLIHNLAERDVKQISVDRNAPEPLRLLARKMVTSGQARKR